MMLEWLLGGCQGFGVVSRELQPKIVVSLGQTWDCSQGRHNIEYEAKNKIKITDTKVQNRYLKMSFKYQIKYGIYWLWAIEQLKLTQIKNKNIQM